MFIIGAYGIRGSFRLGKIVLDPGLIALDANFPPTIPNYHDIPWIRTHGLGSDVHMKRYREREGNNRKEQKQVTSEVEEVFERMKSNGVIRYQILSEKWWSVN